jgi:dihydroflavonol-4-reductase
MKVLVTGVTGFIGGALASRLIEEGEQVSVLVRPASRHKLSKGHHYQVFEAELGQTDPLRQAVANCEVVIHTAAIRNRWGTPRQAYYAVNVEGTRCLLEAAIEQARRFVYVSSVGVLGHPGMTGIDESFPMAALDETNEYHKSKVLAEQIVLAHGSEIEAVVARPTITYGPGDEDGMVTRLIDLIARRRFVRIGRGRNHVHLTYIDDLVKGLILVATHPAAAGQTFILAGPASIQASQFVAMIERKLGRVPSQLFIPESLARLAGWGCEVIYRSGAALGILSLDSPAITRDKVDTLCVHRGFSARAAARVLGYAPRVGYEEGLARTIEWMRSAGRLNAMPSGN